MATEEDIRRVLNTIVDPCSRAAGAPVGLGDMGLIRRVEIDSAEQIRVTIGVTEFGCMMGAAFLYEARQLLADLVGEDAVEVVLDQEFDWEPQDMSPAYKSMLSRRHRATRKEFFPHAMNLPLLTDAPIRPVGG